jgi:toxin ParE1/3/4
MGYKLSRKAEDDLLAIYRIGAAEFGTDQAQHYFAGLEDALDFLATYPRAARERLEIDPPIRAHPHKSHLIIYIIQGDDILILRVRHAREDWTRGE